MMFLLVANDLPDHRRRYRVRVRQDLKLVLKMPKDHAFHGFRSQCDCAWANHASDQAQHRPADAAQMIAAAATHAPPSEFGREQGSVPLFVSNELFDLVNHRRSSPSGNPALRPINRYGAMLPRMVDLQYDFARRTGGPQSGLIHSYEAYCPLVR